MKSVTPFRLFPHPTAELCTPYTWDPGRNVFRRWATNGETWRLVAIGCTAERPWVEGAAAEDVHGDLPDRKAVLHLLRKAGAGHHFVEYVRDTVVVPTFSLSAFEAFVRVVIRQVITARQAKRLFDAFTRRFGVSRDDAFGFPATRDLARFSVEDFRAVGLGMKAAIIAEGLQKVEDEAGAADELMLRGIGPWSRSVLRVENEKTYAFYPFEDKSGQAIEDHCGVSPAALAGRNRELAGAVYVYGASYLEAHR